MASASGDSDVAGVKLRRREVGPSVWVRRAPRRRSESTEVLGLASMEPNITSSDGGLRLKGKHAAWTSVRQERWEGELQVQGEIPIWLVASIEVPPFVTFHFINAYEEEDEEGRVASIVADCCEHYADARILDKLRLQNLRSSTGLDVLPDARVGRFRIPLDGSTVGSLVSALDPEEHGRGMDMCSINRRYLGRPYRYTYACGAQRPCNFPNTLTKIDLLKKTSKNWHDEGSIPSEPFFVERPGATEEDDGVVISMVSGGDGDGYALILDASSFEEIARAKFPYEIPYGLHGCWVQNN